MFSNYYWTKLVTNEFLDLGRSLGGSIETHLASDGYLVRHVSKIKTHIDDIVVLQGRDKSNAFTDSHSATDTERDNLDRALVSAVEAKAQMKAFFPEEGEAAEAVLVDLKTTPVNRNAGHSAQSEQVNVRLKKLNTEENRARLEIMNLLPVLDRYLEVQKSFEELNQKKDAYESAKLRGTVKSHIEEIKERIDFIFSYLTAQTKDIPAKYETAAKEMQESVTRIMAVAEARETRKKNNEE